MSEGRKIVFNKKNLNPTTRKPSVIKKPHTNVNIFNDDGEKEEIQVSQKKTLANFVSTAAVNKGMKEINKAMEENPDVFEYDNIFEQIGESRTIRRNIIETNKSKPKYMNAILESASFRKRENDRRLERKIQKERDTEDPELANTEVFVTESYRLLLEQRKAEDEKLKREEIDEQYSGTTKDGMSDFYRNLINDLSKKSAENTQILSDDKKRITQKKKRPVNLRKTSDFGEDVNNNDISSEEGSDVVSENNTSVNSSDSEITSDVNKIEHEEHRDEIEENNDEIVESGDLKEPEECKQEKSDENLKPKRKFLGIKIYDQRNTEEDIQAAIKRFTERQKLAVLEHFLIASYDPTDY